jgi:diacylglycerol kinase
MSRLARSFAFAVQGIVYGIKSCPNMKIHLLAAVVVFLAGAILRVSRMEWALLTITVFMVLITETINTSLERSVDLASPEIHPIAKASKDVAAGAVLLAALNSIIIGLLVFGPYLIKLLK